MFGSVGLLTAAALATVETRYGLVFDAGSSGTRIHVYSWNVGAPGPKANFDLLKDELLKIKPGLSAYKNAPSTAGSSLRPLLDHARKFVPPEAIATTPVFLMATAGLRMVGEAVKDEILASVCTELSASGFSFSCAGGATLLGGADEGLYGWVTVNYLLNSLYPPPEQPPVGTIDLGGGSVQIVFGSDKATSGETSKSLTFGAATHNVYVKSHLGFGLDEARKAFLTLLREKRGSSPISNPCMPIGATEVANGDTYTGEGDYRRCSKMMAKLFPPTFVDGMPALSGRFYGFSYMYDRTAAIGLIDGTPTMYGQQEMSAGDISRAAAAICALDADATAKRFAAAQDVAKANYFCGDAAYIVALLQSFGFDDSTKLVMTNKIHDVELVWTLGAILAKSSAAAAAGGSSTTFFLFACGLAVVAIVYRKKSNGA